MAAKRIRSIDEFVKEIILDCYRELPNKAQVLVVCERESGQADGSTTYGLEAVYSVGRDERYIYSDTVSLDPNDKLPNYAESIRNMIVKHGIPASNSETVVKIKQKEVPAGLVEISCALLRGRILNSGMVADLLGVSTADVVKAYFKAHKKEPVGHCMYFPEIMSVAKQLRLTDEHVLKCIEVYTSRNS